MTHSPSRRSILAGLAAAPVAGLPAIAGAAPVQCPTLAAAREYRRLKEIKDAAFAECSRINADLEATHKTIGTVEVRGKAVHSIARLDAMRWLPDEISDAEYHAARAVLEPLQAAYERAHAASGYDEADARATEAQMKANDALFAVFDTSPTSPAGALELLRVAAEHIEFTAFEGGLFYELEERFVPAMREAIAVLEKAVGAGVSS